MFIVDALMASLRLLSQRERRLLLVAVVVSTFAAILDLVGIVLLGAVAALGAASVSGAPVPPIIEGITQRWLPKTWDDLEVTAFLFAAAVALLVVKTLVSGLIARRVFRFLANRQARISADTAAWMMAQRLDYLEKRSSQETAYTLTSAISYAVLVVLAQGMVLVSEVILLCVIAVGLMFVDFWLTLGAIAYFLTLALILNRLLSRWATRIGIVGRETDISSYTLIQEALGSYREIFVLDRRGFFINRFAELRWSSAMAQADHQFVSLIPKYLFEIALVLGAGSLLVIQWVLLDPVSAISITVLYVAAGSRVVPSLLRLQSSFIQIRTFFPAAEPAYELLEDVRHLPKASQSDNRSAQIGQRVVGDKGAPAVSIEDVSFAYEGKMDKAVDSISLKIPAASTVALVGPSGAGKSTLADLILGLLRPQSGSIFVNGVEPASACTLSPGSIAYIPQRTSMLNASIRSNVALGLAPESISDALVWEALEKAHLADFVRQLPGQLDALIGEHGTRLSGGQIQRLGVARGLYSEPRLIVLDEATSALDSATEDQIVTMLKQAAESATVIIVAHRLATVREVDLVCYLENGRLVGSGTFNEVRNKNANFAKQASLLGL